MDIRNVQKTGNMHYVYLPTAWCKKQKLTGHQKVSTVMNDDGTLTISPVIKKQKKQDLVLHVKEDNLAILHKLILASYLTPAATFRIMLEKPIDPTKLLEQKKLISLELVEINTDSITCEGSFVIEDIGSLLKTMLRKTKNMIEVMIKSYSKDLVNRYEEEIDRNQLLLDKSIIQAFAFQSTSQLRTIELYYISHLSKDVERCVDLLSIMQKRDSSFLKEVGSCIDLLRDLLSGLGEESFSLPLPDALSFIKRVDSLETVTVRDIQTYEKKRVKEHLSNIAEIIIDWALFYALEHNNKTERPTK